MVISRLHSGEQAQRGLRRVRDPGQLRWRRWLVSLGRHQLLPGGRALRVQLPAGIRSCLALYFVPFSSITHCHQNPDCPLMRLVGYCTNRQLLGNEPTRRAIAPSAHGTQANRRSIPPAQCSRASSRKGCGTQASASPCLRSASSWSNVPKQCASPSLTALDCRKGTTTHWGSCRPQTTWVVDASGKGNFTSLDALNSTTVKPGDVVYMRGTALAILARIVNCARSRFLHS